jgi:hypothetical protein
MTLKTPPVKAFVPTAAAMGDYVKIQDEAFEYYAARSGSRDGKASRAAAIAAKKWTRSAATAGRGGNCPHCGTFARRCSIDTRGKTLCAKTGRELA